MVLSAILSDGRSARLYRKLREELRIANTAWSSYESFDHFGIFMLGAESYGPDPVAAERALWSEIVRLQFEPIGEEMLQQLMQAPGLLNDLAEAGPKPETAGGETEADVKPGSEGEPE